MIVECNLSLSAAFVKSELNIADTLTRVPKRWLSNLETAAVVTENFVSLEQIKTVHKQCHPGVDKTMFMVSQCYPNTKIERAIVEKVVKECNQCRSIDPSPVQWEKGFLHVNETWKRIACDVTHYRGKKFLTVIDCGPSRYAIWKLVKSENDDEITNVMEDIFREMGPPEEVVLDNGRTFRSKNFVRMCVKWGVYLHFRAAYRPQGNGIIERNHRTIKSMAARSGADVRDIVFWYNYTPKIGDDSTTSPSREVFTHTWRYPNERKRQASGDRNWRVGDQVFVKPPGARCTTPWQKGVITNVGGMSSQLCVEVNEIPRHIADIRKVFVEKEKEQSMPDAKSQNAEMTYCVEGCGTTRGELQQSEPREHGQEVHEENNLQVAQRISERPQRSRNPPQRLIYESSLRK
jgi:hypothetical protein